jgi:hypothetical protein
MFAYNPTVNNRAGEIFGPGLERAAAYDAIGTQVAAEADLMKAMRKHQAIIDGVGLVGDAAKKVAGFMIGGPAGAAMASNMGGGGGEGGGRRSMGGGGGGAGGLLDTFVQLYGAKESGKALDKAMGMAADEGMITYDTLEKFVNLPWQQKAPVFDLWRESMLPVQTNRMKVQDQARIWSEYRGAGGGMPPSSANNQYGYVYQGP